MSSMPQPTDNESVTDSTESDCPLEGGVDEIKDEQEEWQVEEQDDDGMTPVDLTVQVTPGGKQRNYICFVCCKRYVHESVLQRHMAKHCDVPVNSNPLGVDLKCMQCGKEFTQRTNLRIHMRIHANDRPHVCEMCSRRFVLPQHLRQHMRTHSDERPWQCNQCARSFKNKSTLQKHVSVEHDDHRPFSCSKCGRGFALAFNLKLHMRKHTGERPYQCTMCDRCFSRPDNLKLHTKRHLNKTLFTCTHCSRYFKRVQLLNEHIKKRHGTSGTLIETESQDCSTDTEYTKKQHNLSASQDCSTDTTQLVSQPGL